MKRKMDSAQLTTILKNRNLLRENDTVIVGCSAGPDSTALLSLLCECSLPLKIIAVYVDHGLRPLETGREIELVKNIAERYGIPCETAAVDVIGYRRRHGASLEESARILRYGILEQYREKFKAEVIAVGHTADDQAEEILLRLFRGTGLKGLSGMRQRSGVIIRPLLHVVKKELLDYLESSKIPYCIDSSNIDRSILRNRLRLDLLPLIEKLFNPAIRSTLLQTAAILGQDDDLLDGLSEDKVAECTRFSGSGETKDGTALLDIESFLENHMSLRRRIIEKICWKSGAEPRFQHIEQVIRLAESGRTGAEIHLPQGLRIYKNSGSLAFHLPERGKKFRGSSELPEIPPLQITAPAEYGIAALNRRLTLELLHNPPQCLLAGELLADWEKIKFPLTLRPAEQGERFTPPGMKGRKKISRFLSDLKIPRQLRYQFPVLAAGEVVVAVPGLQIDEAVAVDNRTTVFLKIKWENQQEGQD